MSTSEKINKVVIPAAGRGTRFYPVTKSQPKEMLPVVDKPVIQYVVEEAVKSGIDDILIITGKNKRAIEDHFDTCDQLTNASAHDVNFSELEDLLESVSIHYIRQYYPNGLGGAIALAEKHCGGEPFGVLLGDTITKTIPGIPTCTQQMISAFNEYNQSVIAVEPVTSEKVSDYGIIDGVKIDDQKYSIKKIVEKPLLNDAPSNLGAIGAYVLTPDIFDCLKRIQPGYGGEIQLTDGLNELSKKIGVITNCKRYDIGDKMGWILSNVELALEITEYRDRILPIINKYY